MATLNSQQIDEIVAEVHRRLSRERTAVALSKAQVRALVVEMDGQQESYESALFAALPGAGQTWVMNNQGPTRTLSSMVAEKRREVL